MEIRFLGYGGAFDTHLINSSAIVSHEGVNTLIDCGHSVFPFMNNSGIIEQVDQVVVTHLHDDHVGSLSAFAIFHSKVMRKGPLPIFGATEAFSKQIRNLLKISLVDTTPYATIKPISEARGSILAIDTFGMHMENLNTFSFVFQEGEQSIVYSGDLGDCDFLMGKIKEIGLSDPLIFHETSFSKASRGHTYYHDLAKWIDEYRIYAYHCNPDKNPADNPIPLVANHPEFNFKPKTISGKA